MTSTMETARDSFQMCCVPSCDKLAADGHTFPEDAEKRFGWIDAISRATREPFSPTDGSKVCRTHFENPDNPTLAPPSLYLNPVFVINEPLLDVGEHLKDLGEITEDDEFLDCHSKDPLAVRQKTQKKNQDPILMPGQAISDDTIEFFCQVCYESFANYELLEDHTREAGHQIHICRGCQRCFEQQISLVRHLARARKCKELYNEEEIQLTHEEKKKRDMDNRAKRRAYYMAHYEEVKAKRREHYHQNRDKYIAKSRMYSDKNRARIREKQADYTARNRELIRQKQAIYTEKNRDKIRERQAIYNEQHRDRIRERQRLYYMRKKAEISEKKQQEQKVEKANETDCKNIGVVNDKLDDSGVRLIGHQVD